MLEKELSFFDKQLPVWLPAKLGKFVLVKEENLIGEYDTVEAALSEGTRLFGLQPFLVRPILERQQEISIPALTLGILNASSTFSTSRPATKP